MNAIAKVVRFYVDGFKSMTIGKTLWTIIIIKFIILFLVLKVFFFPNLLERDYDNDADRANAVRNVLTTEVKECVLPVPVN